MRFAPDVLFVLLLPVLAVLTTDSVASNGSASAFRAAPSGSNASDGDDTIASTALVAGGVYTTVRDLRDGAAELRSFRTSQAANFCHRAPLLVNATAWSMRVANLGNGLLDAPHAVVPATTPADAISITSLGTFIVSSILVSLTLVGESTEAVPLKLELRLRVDTNITNASAVTLVTTGQLGEAEESPLETVHVSNIDLSEVAISTTFLPTQLSRITLQNCNLAALSAEFFSQRHEKLQRLDLSMNRLRDFSTGLTAGSQASAITELNLSSNSFSSFPTSLAALKALDKLYFQGNPLSNFTVTNELFAQLAKLSVLQTDPVNLDRDAVACSGTWQPISDTLKLCVVSGISFPASRLRPLEDTTTSDLLFVAIVIPSCFLVAFVGLTLRRRYFDQQAPRSDSITISVLERTDNAHKPSIDCALLQDPIIVIHRIPFEHVVVAECISQGGFGVVCTGVYKRQRVAIKRLRPEYTNNSEQIEAFLREICLMASLEHPRIVQFVGVAWDDSLRNLSAVTEFMERGDLRAVLQVSNKYNRPLTWEGHKARIALHVAEALAYLHSLSPRVIHRDLKARNVLLNLAYDAKLSDFGISREWNAGDTRLTVGVGTSFWIAPEVLLGEQYDERADVFSFGVVLSELDSGQYPYHAIHKQNVYDSAGDPSGGGGGSVTNKLRSESDLLWMVATGRAQLEFSHECPHAVLELAALCLQRDPQCRPSSTQLVFALRQLLGEGSEYGASSISSEQMEDTC